MFSCHKAADEVTQDAEDVREMRGELMRMEVTVDCGYPEDLNDSVAEEEDGEEYAV